MNTELETNSTQLPVRGSRSGIGTDPDTGGQQVRTGKAGKPKQVRTYVLLVLVWSLLVGGGIYGAKLYSDQLQQQLKADIAAQTELQLAAIQEDYQKQITELRASIQDDMKQLQSKIDSVNELLAFTKDSASSKTDNSNQLYTQLAEVTKKLEELKKQLDALQ
ncbi:hypothetical protein [Paenibacillus sp. YYML68]|uniref:hypothetical protein n=1 Tax=Paenibacillus sp. YYML68 TaxID=2909250 RepID=UPI002492A9DD|nr:hypothetical protein [Paenibacillus sp. YYML68]